MLGLLGKLAADNLQAPFITDRLDECRHNRVRLKRCGLVAAHTGQRKQQACDAGLKPKNLGIIVPPCEGLLAAVVTAGFGRSKRGSATPGAVSSDESKKKAHRSNVSYNIEWGYGPAQSAPFRAAGRR